MVNNKLIKKYVLDIVITILFVIGSYYIWNNNSINKFGNIAKSYEDFNYLALNVSNNYIYNTNNSNNLDDTVITISNESNTIRNYKLVLKVNKNIDSKKLNIKINNTVYNLPELSTIKDNNYNSYVLDTDNIVANYKTINVILFGETNNNNDIRYELIENEVI